MSIIWLRNLIEFINPKIIICLGNESFYYLRDDVVDKSKVAVYTINYSITYRINLFGGKYKNLQIF